MLPLAVIQEVQRLLDEGELSQRKIAQRLHVSRGTVNAMANGLRGIYGREPGHNETSLACFAQLPERCRGCGARVYKPCVLCRARAYAGRQQVSQYPSRRVA